MWHVNDKDVCRTPVLLKITHTGDQSTFFLKYLIKSDETEKKIKTRECGCGYLCSSPHQCGHREKTRGTLTMALPYRQNAMVKINSHTHKHTVQLKLNESRIKKKGLAGPIYTVFCICLCKPTL